MKKRLLLIATCLCCICSIPVWAEAEMPIDITENESSENVEKMNEIVNIYNQLYFESYTEDELKNQEDFQKSIHLLNELYFEYGSLEKIPILPFNAAEPRAGDKLFVNVAAVIEEENGETVFVEDYNNEELLENCLTSLGYINSGNDELTESLKEFQSKEGLEADGIADEEVWRKIDVLM